MSDTEAPGRRNDGLIAALDVDQGEWRLAISDGGRPDISVQPDAGEVQKTIGGFPIVVATEECRPRLSLAALELRPRYVRRLQAIAGAAPEAAGDCLVLWMGRAGASCARIEASRIAGDQVDEPRFSPRGLFDHYAEKPGALHSWLAARQDRPEEIARAFESFLANLKDGTVHKVGPTQWMLAFQRLPKEFLDEGLRRVLAVVDPEHKARKLVLAGWASAARWDLGERIAKELPGIMLAAPRCDPFTESLTGLIEDELARQKRPRLPAPGAAAALRTTTGPQTTPPPRFKTAPHTTPAPSTTPAPQTTPPLRSKTAPHTTPAPTTTPAPQTTPAPTTTPAPQTTPPPSGAEVLLDQPLARISLAVAALVESLGVRAAGPAVTLKEYLQVAKGCAQAAAGDAAAVAALRASLEELERRHAQREGDQKDFRCGFFELLDCVILDDAKTEVGRRAVTLRELAGIDFIDPKAGAVVTKTDSLQILTTRDEGRFVRILKVHQRGYSLDGQLVRKPLVDVERFDPKSAGPSLARLKEYWLVFLCGGMLLLAIGFVISRLSQRDSGYDEVGAPVDAGEPIVRLWGVPGTAVVAALTHQAGSDGCHLRIWRAPAWDAPGVLAAPCGPVAVSPDGEFVAWGSPENLPIVTRTSDNSVWRNMGPPERRHATPLSALAFAVDGQSLYSASQDGVVRIWNTSNGEYIRDLSTPGSHPVSALLAADRSFVAAGEAASPGRVRVWAPECPGPMLLGGASAEITALAFDSEAKTIIGGDADGEVLGWAWEGQPCHNQSNPLWRRRQMDRKVQTILPAPGSRLFVDYSDTVFAWRFGVRGVEDDGDSLDSKNPIAGSAVIDDGENTLLATAEDSYVRLWRISK